jgi:folate-binding protein YgfZ
MAPSGLPDHLIAAPVDRDVLLASGPDVVTYLQGQVSQDVAGLRVGASAWSFLLQPQGKVDAWLRITKLADDQLLLDVDGGFGAAVLARLERFKLRTKAEFEALTWAGVALRGPDANELERVGDDPLGTGVAVLAGWPLVEGVDLLGPADDVHVPEGAELVGPDELEALRIRLGVPRMGAELTEATIPAEAGQWVVDASASFTKGCYTGQELVARIDSRGGNVPRRIRVLELGAATTVPTGANVLSGDDKVGAVTSSAPGVALASLARSVEPPASVELEWDGGSAPAEVLTAVR